MRYIHKKLIAVMLVLAVAVGTAACGEYNPADVLGADKVNVRSITTSEIPAFDGKCYVELNNNIPWFTEDDITTECYENYSKLDKHGRCTQAMACLGVDTMPEYGEERGEIYFIHPSGWKSNQGWERAHLIAWQLSNENANERNLITGTHMLNYDAMRPFEEEVGNYIRDTWNHVIYRVTPVYDGDNLIASGVIMEAISVEDDEICFNVYCYNEESFPAKIDRMTGKVTKLESSDKDSQSEAASENDGTELYLVNYNSGKFHRPDCELLIDANTKHLKEKRTTRKKLIIKGFEPCKGCNP